MLQIKVNNKQFSVSVAETSSFAGEINGQPFGCSIEDLGEGRFLLRKDDRVFEIFLLAASEDGKELDLQLGQSYFHAGIQNEFDQLLGTMGFKSGDAKKAKEVKSPMPGKILSVLVEEGSDVKSGQPLLILEAMKMENVLHSAVDGKVKKVLVEKGSSVNKNEVLIQFI